MSSRAAAAADLRSRIAGNLTASANGEGPEPPRSVVAGVNALPTPPGPESGVMTSGPAMDASTGTPASETAPAAGAAPPPGAAAPAEPVVSAAAHATPPAPAAPIVPPAPVSLTPAAAAPAPPAVAKGWDKLSITLSRSDFGILEVQTGQARAAGIRMRRGGNPSVFLRAALRNLEALRLTNPAAWLELIRGSASSDNT